MTVSAAKVAATQPGKRARRANVTAAYRVEVAKLTAQLLPRLTALVCLVGPFVFALIMKSQTSAPADTLFGRWIHTSGFATPFVVLGFAGIAGFPLLASVVAGDMFAGEDRHSTWKTLLTRSCSRGEVFAGKTLAAITFTVAMVALLAVSSIAAGVLIVGTQPLIGLSGALLSPGRALVLCLESWALALIPTLGFTCLAVLLSVWSRNSMVGVLGPPVIGLVMVLLSLMGSGLVVTKAMLTTGFTTWHGLLAASPTYKPVLFAAVVAFAYGYLCLDAAYSIMRRRDFAGDVSMRATWPRIVRGIAVVLVVVGALAVASALDPTWITSDRLQASVGPTFKNLVVDQQRIIGHAANARSFNVYPFCKRESMVGGPSRGSGDDWICSVSVNGPGLGQRLATYNVVVRPDGCYTAEGPASVVGPLHVRDAHRRTVINPLFAFDGCIIPP